MDLDAYLRDEHNQYAVERNFEIIGEALNRLHKNSPDLANRIPGLRDAVDFRNLLAHGYASVDPSRVWKSIKQDLPQLHKVVKELVAELDSSTPINP